MSMPSAPSQGYPNRRAPCEMTHSENPDSPPCVVDVGACPLAFWPPPPSSLVGGGILPQPGNVGQASQTSCQGPSY